MNTKLDYKSKLMEARTIIQKGEYNLAEIEHFIEGIELFGIKYIDFWLNFVKMNKSTTGFEKTEALVNIMRTLPKSKLLEKMNIINDVYSLNGLTKETLDNFDLMFSNEVKSL